MTRVKFFINVRGANGIFIPINYRNITHIEWDNNSAKVVVGISRIYFPGYVIRVQGDPIEIAAKIEEQISMLLEMEQ
jgi:hypothetical protein